MCSHGHLLLLVVNSILLLGILVTEQADLVPGKIEKSVHALKRSTSGFRDGNDNPKTTNDKDSSVGPEGSVGVDASLGCGQKHVRCGTAATVLAQEIKSLEGNTGHKSALATDNINQEEGTADGGDKLDNTEEGSDKKTSLRAVDTEEFEQIGSVQSNGSSARPLSQNLDHAGEVKTVQVAAVEEELLAGAEERGVDALHLVLVRSLDGGHFADDVIGVDRLLSQASHGSSGLFELTLLDKETGRLVDEEAENEDQTSKHEMKAGRDEPAGVGFTHVQRAAVVGKVGQNDTEIDEAGEDTSAETANS
ncbi:hypothetical protein HG531_004663 [Fusarium graminearum]|nr:hypothetical protein HG531_004663 [Fusarium graminearum]